MGKAYVVGVGMTKFDKPKTKKDDYPQWGKEAILKALDDAKIDYKNVEEVYASYIAGDSCCGQRILQEIGLSGIPIYNVNNTCASGASALYLAKEFIELGTRDCILVVGFEKLDRGSVWDRYIDRSPPAEHHINAMDKLKKYDHKLPLPLQLFGNAGLEHMEKYGTTLNQLAKVAYKNRKNGVNNPFAQFQTEYTIEEILNSPHVYGPLTRLQCCPTTEGAAAAIIVSEKFMKEHNLQWRAIEIVGMEMVTDLPSSFNTDSYFEIGGYDITKTAIQRLLKNTNKTLDDIQLIELHDSFSTLEIVWYEALGLCPNGKSGEFIDSGNNTYGGKFVVNPSGGLISRGHPFGATGIAQCCEICWQLRGEAGKRQVQDVNLALQHNIGLATAVVVALYKKAEVSS